MEKREVRWERMFPDELEAAYEEYPIVYLPYGLCEPHEPLTFDQVEEIWDQEIRPLIKDFEAMQDLRPEQEPPPKDSRWYANWQIKYRG